MSSNVAHISTTASPTNVSHATAAGARRRSGRASAALRTRRPSVTQLAILGAAVLAGLGVVVWLLAGRGVEGAVAGSAVTVGFAALIGSYASCFVSWRQR